MFVKKDALSTGIGFGLTSAVITALGTIIGLSAGTHSKTAVLGGVLTVAIADSFSDALGIHVAEESEIKNTQKEVWQATFTTLFTKLTLAATFALPIVLFSLEVALKIDVAWGFLLLTVFSGYVAKKRGGNVIKAVLENLVIGGFVVFSTHFVGRWIKQLVQ